MLHIGLRLILLVGLTAVLAACGNAQPTRDPVPIKIGGLGDRFCGGAVFDALPVLLGKDGRIVTVDAELAEVELRWPAGTTAEWTADGFFVIRRPNGAVAARQGEFIRNIGVCRFDDGWVVSWEGQ